MGADIDGEDGFSVLSVSISLQNTITTVAFGQEDGTVLFYTTDCPAGKFISSDNRSCLASCPKIKFISESKCVQVCPEGTTAYVGDTSCFVTPASVPTPAPTPAPSQASSKCVPQFLITYVVCIAILQNILP